MSAIHPTYRYAVDDHTPNYVPPSSQSPSPSAENIAPSINTMTSFLSSWSINLTNTPTDPPEITNPRIRASLMSEYLALTPSPSLRNAADVERKAASAATVYMRRIALARDLGFSETPSERKLFDHALTKLAHRASAALPSAHRADHLAKRRREILAALCPRHPALTDLPARILRERRRQGLLRASQRDQFVAMAKLTDAANLLLLIADHIEILAACYGPACASAAAAASASASASASGSAASDCSSEEDVTRVGCLGRSEESRPSIFVSSVPSSYRIRYLRKCWGYAADALSNAVDSSTFLFRELQRLGQAELIPGLEAQCKGCMWLLELPGGLTVFFRTDALHRMAADARAMRDEVEQWHGKVRAFCGKLRKEISRGKKKIVGFEEHLGELRKSVLAEEFRDVVAQQ